ncbi:TPA: hypothetical protein KEO61_001203 [Staphylococcus aureus]|nr:hypothetical protein [Staphylococcus aureus]
MKIGDISIHYLNGGNTKMDGGAMFGVVPKPLWSKQYNANERNQINLPAHPIYWDKNKGDYSNKLILFEKHFEPVPGIKMQHSGGHSFGHTIITIESQGDKAVHMGDIFPTTAHKNPLWVTAYDDYPMQSIREKERMIPYFIQQQYWFLFYHDENYFAVKYSDDGENIDAYILRETLVDNN